MITVNDSWYFFHAASESLLLKPPSSEEGQLHFGIYIPVLDSGIRSILSDITMHLLLLGNRQYHLLLIREKRKDPNQPLTCF